MKIYAFARRLDLRSTDSTDQVFVCQNFLLELLVITMSSSLGEVQSACSIILKYMFVYHD